jgi:hypothetical protein
MSESEAGIEQPESLPCPSCGASVEFRRDRTTAKCRYCGQSVTVTPELRTPSANPATSVTHINFDPKGKFITRLGSSGEGDSQFHSVGAIAVDGQGRIYVVEDSDSSVLKPNGSRLDKISVDGAVRQLFFDDTGALWVTTDDGVLKYEVAP